VKLVINILFSILPPLVTWGSSLIIATWIDDYRHALKCLDSSRFPRQTNFCLRVESRVPVLRLLILSLSLFVFVGLPLMWAIPHSEIRVQALKLGVLSSIVGLAVLWYMPRQVVLVGTINMKSLSKLPIAGVTARLFATVLRPRSRPTTRRRVFLINVACGLPIAWFIYVLLSYGPSLVGG
jgi:hypothetical protein